MCQPAAGQRKRAGNIGSSALRPRRGSVALGDDLNLAAVAVADAFGADTVALAQIEVDYPAVGGCHGLQGDAAAGLRHAIRDPVGHFAEGILAASPVLLNVQRNANVFIVLLAHDALHDELERVQRIAPSPDQKPGVGAVDVDHGAAGQLVVLGAQGHVNFCAHRGQDALDGLDGGSGGGVRRKSLNRRGRVGRAGFIRRAPVGIGFGALRRSGRRSADAGYANLGQFAADAQEPLAAPI